MRNARYLVTAVVVVLAAALGVGLGTLIGNSASKAPPPSLGASSPTTTLSAFVTATLKPNCVWDNGLKAETVTLAYTGTWEFWNESGAGRKLLWTSGTHYATDNWTMANGEALYFTQKAATSATFTTCNGTATLTVRTQ